MTECCFQRLNKIFAESNHFILERFFHKLLKKRDVNSIILMIITIITMSSIWANNYESIENVRVYMWTANAPHRISNINEWAIRYFTVKQWWCARRSVNWNFSWKLAVSHNEQRNQHIDSFEAEKGTSASAVAALFNIIFLYVNIYISVVSRAPFATTKISRSAYFLVEWKQKQKKLNKNERTNEIRHCRTVTVKVVGGHANGD